MSSPTRESPQPSGDPPNPTFEPPNRQGGGNYQRRGRGVVRFGGSRGRGFRRGFGRGGPGGGGPPRNNQDDGGDGDGDDHKMGMGMERSNFQDKVMEKLHQIGGPTVDLPSLETVEKRFSGRNRLYIGNIAPEVNEKDIEDLFSKFGETAEVFVNKEKNFAFIKMDFYANGEKAKRELDGHMLNGKNLKIRFAPNNASIKVKNLSSFVSNELLVHAFSVFGEIERATVCVDERGKATGEGIVEFSRKGYALNALKRCADRCFFLTESLRPVIVESYEYTNDNDGLPEKFLPKRNHDYLKARSKGPRLAEMGSFENEYGLRWKQLIEMYAQKEQGLKKELQMEIEKLEAQMEYARYEHETEMLREELRAREQDRERQKQEWEMKDRQVQEQRRRNEEHFRRQEESMTSRMSMQEEELKRRQQENNLFMQAHQLHNMLDEQELDFQKPSDDNDENFSGGAGGGNGGGGGGGGGGGDDRAQPSSAFRRDRWITDRRDDFQVKRRRF